MAVALAILLAVFSGIAKKAKMNKVANVLGIAAILVFIGWLASGPGFAILNWIENPSVDVPDSVPIPGQ